MPIGMLSKFYKVFWEPQQVATEFVNILLEKYAIADIVYATSAVNDYKPTWRMVSLTRLALSKHDRQLGYSVLLSGRRAAQLLDQFLPWMDS